MLVSFITPAYNAEKTIGKCIESILAQDVKKEVIVVDNASTDGTKKEIRKRRGVRYVYAGKKGEPCARNAGLRVAKGDYIAFVDADVVLPDDWTKKALAILQKDTEAAGVGGIGRGVGGGLVEKAVGMRIYGLDESIQRRYVDSIATMNLLLRREAIGKERYDESMVLGVDTEFNFRIRKKGYRFIFDRSLFVYHHHPTTLSGLAKKWYTYGKNYPYFCTKHKEFRNSSFAAKILFFPVMIASLLLSIFASPCFIAIPLLQIFCLFLFYLYVGLRAGGGAVTLVFPLVHTIKQLAQLFGVMVGLRRML
jgi:glycosyltransferase involved in cell wall biosynthesis